MCYTVLPSPGRIIRAKSRASIIKIFGLDLGNELLQCEFTNELRNHREEIQIVCNHIAVEIRPYFLFHSGSIQSVVGRISERLSCTFADVGDIVFAISITDLLFCPENTVSAYACNRVYYSDFRRDNEHLWVCLLQ